MSDEPDRPRKPKASRAESAPAPIDPERLAALIDGRLGEKARSELLAEINESDDAFEILTEAAAIAEPVPFDAANPTPQQPGESDISQRRGGGSWGASRRWLAVAAGLAGIALVPWGWSKMRDSRADNDPGRFSAALSPASQQVATTIALRPWSATRGESMPVTARAARIGAYVTDIELATRLAAQRNPEAVAMTNQLLNDLITILEETPNGGAATQAYKQIRDQATDSLSAARARNARAAAALIDPVVVNLGAWAEAALHAISLRDSGFFQSSTTAEVLRRAANAEQIPDTGRTIVRALQSTSRANPYSPHELTDQVRRLLRELAG